MKIKWIDYFYTIARSSSILSKDPSTKVGCVIVGRNRNILSAGFNGFPINVLDSELRYNDRNMKLKYIVHAEANAIAFASRSGIMIEGSTIFSTKFPCNECSKLIIQSGISSVYSPVFTRQDIDRYNIKHSISMLLEAGVRINLMIIDNHHVQSVCILKDFYESDF